MSTREREEKIPRVAAVQAASSLCSSGTIGARASQALILGSASLRSASGISTPVALARPKRHGVISSTPSQSIVTERRVWAPAPTIFSARRRSIPPPPSRRA